MAEENIHKGHRQRMIKKYLEHGIDCFEEHEVLEVLLFSCYPRRNTNDIAHDLIRRFGSLNGVLNASYEDLCDVDNVGPSAASMIKFFKDFAMRHAHEDNSGVVLLTRMQAMEFCYKLLKDCTVEVAHVLLLDDSYTLISESRLSRGVTTSVEFDLKTIVTKALKNQSSKVILVHNHPNGVLLPSAADVAVTRRVANSLNAIGIELVDHVIVNEEFAYSMRHAGILPDIWFSC